MMWSVWSITAFATSDGVAIPSRHATEPARFVGPCMQLASSCTTPSSLGSPPSPTDWSFGLSSTTFTPATIASSGSPPFASRSYATWMPRFPLASTSCPLSDDTTMGRVPARGWRDARSTTSVMRGSAPAGRASASPAAAPAPAPRKSRREMDTRGSWKVSWTASC